MTRLKPIHYIDINNSTMYLISDIVTAFSLDYKSVIRKISPNYVQVKMSPFKKNELYVSAENLHSIKNDFNNELFSKFIQYINHIISEDVFNTKEQTINYSPIIETINNSEEHKKNYTIIKWPYKFMSEWTMTH